MTEPLLGSEHTVDHGAIRLSVWEKCLGSPEGKPVVVLAHGSSAGGRECFDLQAPGRDDLSFMEALARQGFDVFAADMRGFGRSTRPEVHLSTEEASADLAAVVEHICALRGVAQVNLVAWSWGTQYGGQFVMARPERVARYVSYAQMHLDSPDLKLRRERLAIFQRSPYLRVAEGGWTLRFHSLTPPEVNDPVVLDAFAAAASAVQDRTPTGAQVDLLTRLPLVDATRITVPTLMVHGQYDDVADLPGLWPFFAALPNPDKQYTVVPGGGHMLHLQAGRRRLHQVVVAFLRVH